MISWQEWQELSQLILTTLTDTKVENFANILGLLENLNGLIFSYHHAEEWDKDKSKLFAEIRSAIALLVVEDFIKNNEDILKQILVIESFCSNQLEILNSQNSVGNVTETLRDSIEKDNFENVKNILNADEKNRDLLIKFLLKKYCYEVAVEEDKTIAVINLLHQGEVDFNWKVDFDQDYSDKGVTLVYRAVEAKRLRMLATLIAVNANVDLSLNLIKSPLYHAIVYRQIAFIELLLKANADKRDASIALHHLLLKIKDHNLDQSVDYFDTIKILIKAGVTVDIKDKKEEFLKDVVKGGRKKTTELLLDLGAEAYEDIGKDAIYSNNIELVHFLFVERKIPLPSDIPPSIWGKTLSLEMFQYCFNGRMSLINYSIVDKCVLQTPAALEFCLKRKDEKDKLDQWVEDERLQFAAYAAIHANTESMITLIDAGLDPNATVGHGTTPLHHAAKAGNVETTKVLIRAGADFNATDVDGMTPLHWAVPQNTTRSGEFSTKAIPCVEVLLYAGAKSDIEDNKKRKPLDYLYIKSSESDLAASESKAWEDAFKIVPRQAKKGYSGNVPSLVDITASFIANIGMTTKPELKNLNYRKNILADIAIKIEAAVDEILTPPKPSTVNLTDTASETTDIVSNPQL